MEGERWDNAAARFQNFLAGFEENPPAAVEPTVRPRSASDPGSPLLPPSITEIDPDSFLTPPRSPPLLPTIMSNSSISSLDLPVRGASPASSISGSYANTNGASNGANYASPLPAGHQQDLNYLYEQIQELSNLLKANRARTAELTKRAEQAELAQSLNGVHLEDGEGSVQSDQARIRELERELAKKDVVINAYKHEQKENTSLIAMYEDAMGNTTEAIRNYCNSIEGRFLEQRRHYNKLLQQEKDEHLASRLEKDDIFAKYMRCREMIRTANRLRTDEWTEEYAIVAGLQGQVRCLRRILQMDVEKPEEEIGWPYLKDLPLNDTD